MAIRMYDLIEKKKRGLPLAKEELFQMIGAYVDGNIPDYQMSAWLMAVYFNSMTDSEIFDLTEAMALSGDTVDLSVFGDRSVDKHSTGGVGDKTTLIVAPIVAACGGIVAKMSGRGLGHTGGTVDKLESFEGFHTTLSPEQFIAQVQKCGLAVIGQSGNLAPADKKLYALRDVTATVDSIPLIASSIMSKKLAAGTRSIVLDVKCGSGAFMRERADAEKLAEMMVKIGVSHGRKVAAVITDMNRPLGYAVGNLLEVCEAVEVLKGGGPLDLREVCLTLASVMVSFSCKCDIKTARLQAEDALQSGKALEYFCDWISLQGGNAAHARDPHSLGQAKYSLDILSETEGYITGCNAELIGTAAMLLGAGREKADDVIDPKAGIILLKKTGDHVKKGDILARLYTERENTLEVSKTTFLKALSLGIAKPEEAPLVYKIIGI